MRRFCLLLTLLLALPIAAFGQSLSEDRKTGDDRGFLTGLLEESLGGEGRIVRIDGFAGALSSTATIERITIADTDGLWLEMQDLALSWNRSALLRGRIEIAELRAATIDLIRAPISAENETVSPEAGGFSLPQLPVSLDIQTLDVDVLSLGPTILGRAAQMRLRASASLIGGSAQAVLSAQRIDGQQGRFDIDAAYDGDTQNIALQLDLQEAADGIAAMALGLPGKPSVTLSLQGAGPVTDFETRLELQTNGAPRASGQFRIQENDANALGFALDLSGDLAPLLPAAYSDLLGSQARITARGNRPAAGGLILEQFDLGSGAATLSGAVTLSPDNLPVRIDVTGSVGAPDGGMLTLPAASGQTQVDQIALSIQYDAQSSDAWRAMFDIAELSTPGFAARSLSLEGAGTLQTDGSTLSELTGEIGFTADGLTFDDPAVQSAAGNTLTGTVKLATASNAPLQLADLRLGGADFALTGDITIEGLDDAFRTDLDVALAASDISRFSGLAGTTLDGRVNVALDGFATAGGSFDVRVRGTGDDLATGIAQADALLAGQTELDIKAVRDEQGIRLPRLDIRNDQVSLKGAADLATNASTITFRAAMPDATLIDPALKGALDVQGNATQSGAVWRVDVSGTGPLNTTASVVGTATGPAPRLAFNARIPEVQTLVPQVTGAAQLDGTLEQKVDGWHLKTQIAAPYSSQIALNGRVSGTMTPDVTFDLSIPDIGPVAPGYSGPLNAAGSAKMTKQGLQIATDVIGPFGVEGRVAGRVTGTRAPDMTFDLRLPDVAPLAPGFSGAVALNGRAAMEEAGLRVMLDATGPYRATARIEGLVTGENTPNVDFTLQLPNVAPLAPGFRGPLSLAGNATQGANGLQISTDVQGPYGARASARGILTGTAPTLQFDASVPDIAPLGTGINGLLAVSGTAQQDGDAWTLDTQVNGPSQSVAQVAGRVEGGQLDITANGTAPLGLSEPFLKPRSLQGLARFDVRLFGAPALSSVSGTIETDNARFTAPNARLVLENITTRIGLQNGTASITAQGNIATGGQIQSRGTVALTGGYAAALTTDFRSVRLVDPELYDVLTSGQISVTGPLTGGARISGQIAINEAQIQVPSSTATGFTIIPQITHQNASPALRQTLNRAGLSLRPQTKTTQSRARPYPLDLTITAPARLFVRGRGLDAELGGSLRLSGDTNAVISVGGFELIRGRLDVLGRRFTLDEGKVALQGQFDPFLRFVATTDTAAGTASVIIDGPASQPQVSFTSNPSGPEDEVLAQIFFGRSAAQLTPFQAVQLASAVASLSGGGGGFGSTLRMELNLDDLDVTTNEDGEVGLALGKYLSDNVYLDVLIGDRDDAGVSLNVDLSPNITVRSTANARGGGALGVFFEKDY